MLAGIKISAKKSLYKVGVLSKGAILKKGPVSAITPFNVKFTIIGRYFFGRGGDYMLMPFKIFKVPQKKIKKPKNSKTYKADSTYDIKI